MSCSGEAWIPLTWEDHWTLCFGSAFLCCRILHCHLACEIPFDLSLGMVFFFGFIFILCVWFFFVFGLVLFGFMFFVCLFLFWVGWVWFFFFYCGISQPFLFSGCYFTALVWPLYSPGIVYLHAWLPIWFGEFCFISNLSSSFPLQLCFSFSVKLFTHPVSPVGRMVPVL